MADLRNVRAELEAKRKELAALEEQARREEAEPLAEAIKQAILENGEACKFLCSLGKDGTKLVGKLVAESLPGAEEELAEELERLRQRKRDKAARRREREAEKAGTMDTMTSNSVEGEAPQTAWTDGDA